MDNGGSIGGGTELSFDDFEFELSHILWEVVIIVDMSVGEPGSGFCGRVGAKEGSLEVFDEVSKVSKRGGIKDILGTDSGLTFCHSFSHEGEGISDLFVIGGINIFVDQEVSPDQV